MCTGISLVLVLVVTFLGVLLAILLWAYYIGVGSYRRACERIRRQYERARRRLE